MSNMMIHLLQFLLLSAASQKYAYFNRILDLVKRKEQASVAALSCIHTFEGQLPKSGPACPYRSNDVARTLACKFMDAGMPSHNVSFQSVLQNNRACRKDQVVGTSS